MQFSLSIVSKMKQIVRTIPPSGVVLVGAGDGSDEWMSFLCGLTNVNCLIAEADQMKFKFLEKISTSKPTWNFCNAVISKDPGVIDFYQTTMPSENSLIAPDQLRHIWPNLLAQQVVQQKSMTLGQLLNGTVSNINWLLINCLPALPIIEGMVDNLDIIDVICSRVILSSTDAGPESANLNTLQDFLEIKGYLLDAVEPSIHPSLGHALFIRKDCIGRQSLPQQAVESDSTYELLPNRPEDAETKIKVQMNIHSLSSEKDVLHEPSLIFYQKFSETYTRPDPPPFLLIDSKSLPRSGLHYLKGVFTQLLGDQFSFCEWYNEVGCCKHYPCSLHCYAVHAGKKDIFRLRLTKSHDFKHTDPEVPTSNVLQRLVLIRDPLFILTSWFELDQLTKYRNNLLESGIDIRKIWLMHEKELQVPAYEILSGVFVPPSRDECRSWLVDKARYIIRFTNNWVLPNLWYPDPHTRVIRYENIDEYVMETINPYRSFLSKKSIKSLDKFPARISNKFAGRKDPYSLHTNCIETYIREMADMFQEAVAHISHGTTSFK